MLISSLWPLSLGNNGLAEDPLHFHVGPWNQHFECCMRPMWSALYMHVLSQSFIVKLKGSPCSWISLVEIENYRRQMNVSCASFPNSFCVTHPEYIFIVAYHILAYSSIVGVLAGYLFSRRKFHVKEKWKCFTSFFYRKCPCTWMTKK